MVVGAPAASASQHEHGQGIRPVAAATWHDGDRWGQGHPDPRDARSLAQVLRATGETASSWTGSTADRSIRSAEQQAHAAWTTSRSLWQTATTAGPPTYPSNQDRPTSSVPSDGQEGSNASIRPSAGAPAISVPASPRSSDHPVTTTTTAPTPPTTVAHAANPADAGAGVRTVPVTTVTTVPAVAQPIDVYRSVSAAPQVARQPTAPPSTVAPAHPATAPTKPVVSRPAAPEETFPGAFGEPMVLARGAWQGLSLRAATDLKVPISLLIAVAAFLLVQVFVDRRDPKVAAAPQRGTDDTVGFQ